MEPTEQQSIAAEPSPPRRGRRILFWLAVFFLVGLPIVVGLAVGGYYYLSRDLPDINSISDYRPNLITELYSDDGTLIGEFAEERRIVVPIEQIPQRVKDAFISVEDARFFEHRGLDYVRIAGAFWHNFKSGEIKGQGASTITMQVARSFFLSRKKLWSRKIKEAMLAYRIERRLNKDEILHLYLNQIYLGRGAYGVQAAAEGYFGKDVKELDLAEAAMLAGLAQRPSAYSPTANFHQSKVRQRTVLSAMVDAGKITKAEAEAAYKEPLKIVERPSLFLDRAPYFTEYVRRYLVNTYGEEAVLREGYKVFTTVNLELQQAAREAVKNGLAGPEGLDKRQGYRGPLDHLAEKAVAAYLEEREKELRDQWRDRGQEQLLAAGKMSDEKQPDLKVPDPVPLREGESYQGVVSEVDDKKGQVAVKIGHSAGTIALADMTWAHKPNFDQPGDWQKIKRPSEALKAGDVILVRVKSAPADPTKSYGLALEQEPLVQAGLIAFSGRTGEVKALVGGYDFTKNQYIRPVQSARQPGSGFKPIIYGAAFESPEQKFTPATIMLDSPYVWDQTQGTGPSGPKEGEDVPQSWRPENYGQEFSGPRTLRQALTLSINTISIKILDEVGLPYTKKFAKTIGIVSPLEDNLSIALGSSPVTLEELAEAFNVYGSGGYLVPPRYVNKVYDREGNLLEWEWSGKTAQPASSPAAFTEEDIKAKPAAPGAAQPAAPAAASEKRPVPPSEVHQPSWEKYLQTLRANPGRRFASLSEPAHGQMVISPQTAYLMTNLMRGVVEHGTAFKAHVIGKPIAGKTGTTNDFKDAWFTGFSPELTCGVWVGFDDFGKTLGKGETGAKAALPIWIDFMSYALKDRPALGFPVPAGIEFDKIDATTGLLAAPCSEKTVDEAFKAGTAPTQVSSCSATDLSQDPFRTLDY